MVSLQDYEGGREQSYVKHVFLEQYLERLAHKVASVYPCVAYIDGFAGPWQSANERFEDTSFGIALAALRTARATWKPTRDVRMSAFLVERDPASYAQLAKMPERYPDIDVKTYEGDFVSVLPHILSDIPAHAFAFFFIDPKGWRMRLRSLEPLLARPKSEVIFNFMFDFINRAVSIQDPAVMTGLDELMPYGDFRMKLEAAERSEPHGLSPGRRKAILVEAFAESLSYLGRYDYVAETTVLRPVKDRPLYCLFYATRHATGLEVFRDCQVRALTEQSSARAAGKLRRAESATGQREMFQSLHEMGPNELTSVLEAERTLAEQFMLDRTPQEPDSILWRALWPQVLARHVVRLPDANQIAAQLRRKGELLFPDWEKGKRVPQPEYRTQRK